MNRRAGEKNLAAGSRKSARKPLNPFHCGLLISCSPAQGLARCLSVRQAGGRQAQAGGRQDGRGAAGEGTPRKKAVMRFLRWLTSEGMITQKPCREGRHLTICKYGTYQDARDTSGDTSGTPAGTPTGTNRRRLRIRRMEERGCAPACRGADRSLTRLLSRCLRRGTERLSWCASWRTR